MARGWTRYLEERIGRALVAERPRPNRRGAQSSLVLLFYSAPQTKQYLVNYYCVFRAAHRNIDFDFACLRRFTLAEGHRVAAAVRVSQCEAGLKFGTPKFIQNRKISLLSKHGAQLEALLTAKKRRPPGLQTSPECGHCVSKARRPRYLGSSRTYRCDLRSGRPPIRGPDCSTVPAI